VSYELQIAQIDTILKSATGVIDNNVYKYDRLSRNWEEYLSAFKDATNSVIHGWTITRTKVVETPEASRTNEEKNTWLMRFYYSLGSYGATEDTFQDIIEAVRTAFRSNSSLNGTALTSTPIQVDIIEARMFGEVLCHYAELRFESTLEVRWS
jgi:hypothetical protein